MEEADLIAGAAKTFLSRGELGAIIVMLVMACCWLLWRLLAEIKAAAERDAASRERILMVLVEHTRTTEKMTGAIERLGDKMGGR